MGKVLKMTSESRSRRARSITWWLKRLLKRTRRRAEKRDPENAGTKMRHFTDGLD